MNDGAVWLTARVDAVPDGDDWLGEAELQVQAKLRFEPRRRSWRLGRWTAKRALGAVLDVPGLARITVLAAEDGAPEPYLDGARLDLHLSISHREALGAAAVGPDPLGLDLEAVEPRKASFMETFFTPAEIEAVRASEAPDLVTTLTWSGKESLLKQLRTGLRRDTRRVQVEAIEGSGEEGWGAFVVHDLDSDQRHRGHWRRLEGLVLTAVCAGGAPPRALAPRA